MRLNDKSNHKYYDVELSYIKDKELLDRLVYILDYVVHPDNYIGRASSTKKHHPPFANTVHGLVKHTRALVKILVEVFMVIDDSKDIDWDLVIAAGILHDCAKYNGSLWTNQEHATEGAKLIKSYIRSDDNEAMVSKLNKIADIIESHMGRWDILAGYTVNDMSKEQLYVHIADFIVSRDWYSSSNRYLEMNESVAVTK